jgi:hypothetical protein
MGTLEGHRRRGAQRVVPFSGDRDARHRDCDRDHGDLVAAGWVRCGTRGAPVEYGERNAVIADSDFIAENYHRSADPN